MVPLVRSGAVVIDQGNLEAFKCECINLLSYV